MLLSKMNTAAWRLFGEKVHSTTKRDIDLELDKDWWLNKLDAFLGRLTQFISGLRWILLGTVLSCPRMGAFLFASCL